MLDGPKYLADQSDSDEEETQAEHSGTSSNTSVNVIHGSTGSEKCQGHSKGQAKGQISNPPSIQKINQQPHARPDSNRWALCMYTPSQFF